MNQTLSTTENDIGSEKKPKWNVNLKKKLFEINQKKNIQTECVEWTGIFQTYFFSTKKRKHFEIQNRHSVLFDGSQMISFFSLQKN